MKHCAAVTRSPTGGGTVPIGHLEAIAALSAEHEQLSAVRIAAQFVGDQRRETVEGPLLNTVLRNTSCNAALPSFFSRTTKRMSATTISVRSWRNGAL